MDSAKSHLKSKLEELDQITCQESESTEQVDTETAVKVVRVLYQELRKLLIDQKHLQKEHDSTAGITDNDQQEDLTIAQHLKLCQKLA